MYDLLIVDDEEYVLNGMRNAYPWQQLGFRVAGTSGNGLEALNFVRSEQPHVVLTDVMMPELDGLELAGMIRNEFPHICVVLLSAYNDFKFAQQAIRHGVKGYLLKPAEESEVHAMFSDICTELTTKGGIGKPTAHDQGKDGTLESARSGHMVSDNDEKQFVIMAKRYVSDKIDCKITMEEVAKSLYITPAYFSVAFKKETGQNFIDYIMQVKIEKAKKLLQSSDYRVKDIAVKIGYDDYTYFCKIFKKIEGKTPLEYRSEKMR